MSFGDILEKWERQSTGNQVYDKDAEASEEQNLAGKRRYRLLRKKPDAHIDLHGLNSDEAWLALEAFFENSRREGLEKLLIIHGKGNHRGFSPPHINGGFGGIGGNEEYRPGEGILRDISRRFIESCSFAGESGYSHAREGGTGSTWVILKEKET